MGQYLKRKLDLTIKFEIEKYHLMKKSWDGKQKLVEDIYCVKQTDDFLEDPRHFWRRKEEVGVHDRGSLNQQSIALSK